MSTSVLSFNQRCLNAYVKYVVCAINEISLDNEFIFSCRNIAFIIPYLQLSRYEACVLR